MYYIRETEGKNEKLKKEGLFDLHVITRGPDGRLVCY